VFGFVSGASISAKQDIHERRDVGIVASVAVAVVVPVVEFRGTDEHAERAERKADIGVKVDRPKTTEDDETGDAFEGKSEDHGGEIDEAHGVNRIERVFAVSGKPVEMFGAVVDSMEPPEKADAVLKAMAPVDQAVAQQNDLDGLEPPGLRGDGVAETFRNEAAHPVAEVRKDPENKATPEEILAEEETEVSQPGRTKEALPSLGRKNDLKGSKNKDKEEETEARRESERVQIHGRGSWIQGLLGRFGRLGFGGRMSARCGGRGRGDKNDGFRTAHIGWLR
jgi:hypothetical protein